MEKEQIAKTISQGVCSVITTLRPTHIRNHSPSTQCSKREGGHPFNQMFEWILEAWE